MWLLFRFTESTSQICYCGHHRWAAGMSKPCAGPLKNVGVNLDASVGYLMIK